MRKLLKRIEAAFAGAAFAEEGEVEMARQLLAEPDPGEPGKPAAGQVDPAPKRRRPFASPPRIARLP